MSRREKKQIKLPSWDLRFLQGFVVLKSNQNYIFVNLSQEKREREREENEEMKISMGCIRDTPNSKCGDEK